MLLVFEHSCGSALCTLSAQEKHQSCPLKHKDLWPQKYLTQAHSKPNAIPLTCLTHHTPFLRFNGPTWNMKFRSYLFISPISPWRCCWGPEVKITATEQELIFHTTHTQTKINKDRKLKRILLLISVLAELNITSSIRIHAWYEEVSLLPNHLYLPEGKLKISEDTHLNYHNILRQFNLSSFILTGNCFN